MFRHVFDWFNLSASSCWLELIGHERGWHCSIITLHLLFGSDRGLALLLFRYELLEELTILELSDTCNLAWVRCWLRGEIISVNVALIWSIDSLRGYRKCSIDTTWHSFTGNSSTVRLCFVSVRSCEIICSVFHLVRWRVKLFKTPIEVILHLEPVGLQLLDILRLQSIKQLLLAIIISLIIEVGAINFVWAKSHFASKTTSWLLVM